jgi:hypothetical protein
MQEIARNYLACLKEPLKQFLHEHHLQPTNRPKLCSVSCKVFSSIYDLYTDFIQISNFHTKDVFLDVTQEEKIHTIYIKRARRQPMWPILPNPSLWKKKKKKKIVQKFSHR